jgi:putative MATE family efflux protein
MFIFDFGIAGAAFATVISNIAASIAIGYIVFGRIYNFDLKKLIESLGFNLKTSTRILRIGGWACLQQVARPITGMLMFSLVYSVGAAEGSAAFNIGAQLFNYTFIILGGLSMAISVMVGQALGRNDIDSCDSIIKQGMKVAIINILVFGVLYIAIPGQIIGLFRDEPLVVQYGISYMRIVYAGIIFVAWTSIYSGVFQGAGDTFPPMISAMVANVVLKLPLAYLLAYPFKLGIDGVWIAISLSVVIEALGIILSFRKGKWKQKQI